MATQIKCNKCGNEIEVTEAIRAELEAKVLAETQTKHLQALKKLEQEKKILIETNEQELEKVKVQAAESARKTAIEQVRKEYDSKIQNTKEEAVAQELRNKELQQQNIELLKQQRELKNEKDRLSIEFEKKLLEGQDKIKDEAKKEAQDELGLKIAEKEKKLNDAEKQILELQRKLQQGSQQLQGEVQELELETLLRAEFPFDEIKEVPKGINGADVLQVVRTQSGIECGTIIWESKRTKNWSPQWVQKLIEDQRAVKAELAVIVTNVLPQNIKTFGMVETVLVTNMQSAINVAYLLRQQLQQVRSAYLANDNKTTKAEIVYNYLISNEFKQRIEVWVEYFKDRQEKINKERIYFTKKWQEEEKSIQKVMSNTASIYGDLQGYIGEALPKIGYLELSEVVE